MQQLLRSLVIKSNLTRQLSTAGRRQANEAIAKNPPVKTYFMKREEALQIPGITKLASAAPPDVKELRIVEIEGLDLQADGGVHVKSLGEIGRIDPLKFENKGKSNRRLYFMIP
jgi:misacylated tRNA(Ala) deacylase